MKKITAIFTLLFVICTICLCSCNSKFVNDYNFDAIVVDVQNDEIIVKVETQGNTLLEVGTEICIIYDTESHDELLQRGDAIRVYYDGIIHASFPPKISNVHKISKLDN